MSRENVEAVRGVYDRIAIEAEELVDAGATVVATVRQSGVGAGSGVPTGFGYFQAWTFSEGRVVRLENFRDRPEDLR